MVLPGGVLLPPGVGFPPFQVVGVGEKEGEERGKEGGSAPHPIRIGLGGTSSTLAFLSSITLRPNKAHILRGGVQ